MFIKYASLVAFLVTIQNIAASSSHLIGKRGQTTPCAPKNAAVRKAWGNLTLTERKSYIDAVLCLQSKPSILNSTEVPAAQSHFDDFVAVHINQTQTIHLSGYFLPWHRVFVSLYEKALHDCGYKGAQPYWDWPLYTDTLESSPLFDGSDTSLSGNGAYLANNTDYTFGPGVTLPHGNGGLCITDGPFVNMSVSFRPFEFAEAIAGVPPVDPFVYTPRCLTRDLNVYVANRYLNQSDVDALIYNTSTIAEFQNTMSGVPGSYALGVHGGGHLTMGAIGADMFTSPADPAFFFHHAMIDLVWTFWQSLDPKNRQFALSGTQTILNIPPSPNVTLSDVMNWGALGPEMTIEEAMSVTAGPFCYEYEWRETV